MIALISLGNQFVDLAVRDLGKDAVAFSDRQQDRIQHGVHALHNFRVRPLKLFRLAALGELPFFRRVGQASKFLVQTPHHRRDIVDRLLHLLVIAFISLGNQFIDLAIRDLGEDAVAFPNRQQDRIQHGVHALHNFRIRPLELLRLAPLGELPFFRRVGQASQFLVQTPHHRRDIVDRLLHLLVIAFISLGNQFVDLAVRDLGEDAVAFSNGKQDGVQHRVHALYHPAMNALKFFRPRALAQASFLRRLEQPLNLLGQQ